MNSEFIIANSSSIEEIKNFINKQSFSMIVFKLFKSSGSYVQYDPVIITSGINTAVLYTQKQHGSIILTKDNEGSAGYAACEGKQGTVNYVTDDYDRYIINEINLVKLRTIKEIINVHSNMNENIIFLYKGNQIPTCTNDMKKELISSISKFYQI